MSTDESSEIPPPAQAIIAAPEAPDLAKYLHALGERPLFHFIDEVERGYPLRAHLEAYARLDPHVVALLGGSHFGAPVFVIEGGRGP